MTTQTHTAPTVPAFRYLGVTDECVNCELCGKPDLRSTVVLATLDTDGNTEDVVYYGSTCASRALGRSATTVRKTARDADTRTRTLGVRARNWLTRYGATHAGTWIGDGAFTAGIEQYVTDRPWTADQRDTLPYVLRTMAAQCARDLATAKLLDPTF